MKQILAIVIALAIIVPVCDNLEVIAAQDYSLCDSMNCEDKNRCINEIYDKAIWFYDLGRYIKVVLFNAAFTWFAYKFVPYRMRIVTFILAIIFIDSVKELIDLIIDNNESSPVRDIIIYLGLIGAGIAVHARHQKWLRAMEEDSEENS